MADQFVWLYAGGGSVNWLISSCGCMQVAGLYGGWSIRLSVCWWRVCTVADQFVWLYAGGGSVNWLISSSGCMQVAGL